jgi:hypothetical protein
LFRGAADVPLVHTLYHTYSLLHEHILKFPKSQRYSLGAACQIQLLQILEAILLAAVDGDSAAKANHLRLASAKLDLMRLQIRLAKDCRCLSNQAYLELESKLHEAGRMLGGWLRSIK